MLTIAPIYNAYKSTTNKNNILNRTDYINKNYSKDMFILSKHISFGTSGPNEETIEWYDKNAQTYFDETKGRGMDEEYLKFLKYIPTGGEILDAGCGSGRDAKNFSAMGYKVTAFDASSELTKLASKFTGFDVETATFADFKSPKKFDGIWACTSLLHVPKNEFEKSFSNLANHLNKDGIIFAYMKAGITEEKDAKGRFFNYVSIDELKNIFSKYKNLELVQISQAENDFRIGDHPFIEFVIKKIK